VTPAASHRPQRIAIATHPKVNHTGMEATALIQALQKDGAQDIQCASIYNDTLRQKIQQKQFDTVIALGGDGTMLRVARLCAPLDVPVLGINLGHLGFLMAINRQEWDELIPRFMQGDYRVEERMMLRAELLHANKNAGSWDVVNDVVICRGPQVRPIQLTASLDGYPLASYVADGLIVATPTGSTAYALAAGGPILPPNLRNILVVPIAPHRSLEKAIILNPDQRVTVTMEDGDRGVVSVDGQAPQSMEHGDHVVVSVNIHSARFIRLRGEGQYFKNLSNLLVKNPSVGDIP
jgi:NAD+ kinase